MDQKLLDFIRSLSASDTKTMIGKTLKGCEELGELAKCVLPYENAGCTQHRFVVKENIIEEAVDTLLCVLSVMHDVGATDDEIEDMMWRKATTWNDLQLKEKKAAFPIPYEIHITVHRADREEFTRMCTTLNVKPIFLALHTESSIVEDVMTSSKHIGTNSSVYIEMQRIEQGLHDYGYEVVRSKIETTPWHPAAPHKNKDTMQEHQYFETHIAVEVSDVSLTLLKKIVEVCGAHLSKNIMKGSIDGKYIMMVTLRNSCLFHVFQKQQLTLVDAIDRNGFTFKKPITEFALYDTKLSHDTEWING